MSNGYVPKPEQAAAIRLIQEGIYEATVIGFIDCGTVLRAGWGEQPQVAFVFELHNAVVYELDEARGVWKPALDYKTRQPILPIQEVVLSSRLGAKTKFVKDFLIPLLINKTGQTTFSGEELAVQELNKFVTDRVKVKLVHKKSEKTGQTFQNIESVVPYGALEQRHQHDPQSPVYSFMFSQGRLMPQDAPHWAKSGLIGYNLRHSKEYAELNGNVPATAAATVPVPALPGMPGMPCAQPHRVYDPAVPGIQMPGIQMPGIQMPGIQMPAGQMPGIQMPAGQMPAGQMPGIQMPGIQMPGIQMPGVGSLQPPLPQQTGLLDSLAAVAPQIQMPQHAAPSVPAHTTAMPPQGMPLPSMPTQSVATSDTPPVLPPNVGAAMGLL